jgi:hypothetical protein
MKFVVSKDGQIGLLSEEKIRSFFKIEPGPAGPPGRDGAPGKDGVGQILMSDLIDFQGPPGKDGKDGISGKDGPRGFSGKDGPPGKDGLRGPPGKDGLRGPPGKEGPPGKDGRDGLPGVDGRDGKDAMFPFGGNVGEVLTRVESGIEWRIPPMGGIGYRMKFNGLLPLAGGTMIGAIKLPDGSAAAPALVWNTNDGIFHSTSLSLSFAFGGRESLRSGINTQSTPYMAFGNFIDQATIAGRTMVLCNVGPGISTNFVSLGEGVVNFTFQRLTPDANGPILILSKARGSVASPTVPLLNDVLGQISFSGQTGAAAANNTIGGRIIGIVTETSTPSATAMGTDLRFSTCANGSGGLTEVLRLNTSGLQMFGGNTVVSQDRLIVQRGFLVNSLPVSVPNFSRCFVTNATTSHLAGIGLTVAGSGAFSVPVYTVNSGTTWLIG